ncbi:VPS4-associated protein 1 [Xylariales sp. AK1849]|nr:VPS4-associated protein 1 [Xylariales sp. AK1849]
MSIPNIWHHRKVADSAAKSCDVCFKPSTSVLITPEKQDFFYVCPIHLEDTRFCTPIIDEEAVAARKKKEMDEEIERVKKEYEEKQRKKKEKEKDKAKSDDKEKDAKADDEKKDEVKPNGDAKSGTASPMPRGEEPRVFALHRSFHQQRLNKKQQAEIAKRNRERLSNPNLFPSVPKGAP